MFKQFSPSFFFFFFANFSLETGILEKTINISCRDSISNVLVFLQPNTTHCGRYKEDFYHFERHDLIHAYVSGGISSVKIPSLPCSNNGGQLEGITKKGFKENSVIKSY